jgi:hypothetical protein
MINGINVSRLQQQGTVYRFEQRYEITHTCFSNGLCLGFAASLMRRLLNNDFSCVQEYRNPLSKPILIDAQMLTYQIINHFRDGQSANAILFANRRTNTVYVDTNMISPVLNSNVQGATLFYKTKTGGYHTLLFFNKGNGKCVIQDANRFTANDVDLQSGIDVLKEVVDRSQPEKIEIIYTLIPPRARL